MPSNDNVIMFPVKRTQSNDNVIMFPVKRTQSFTSRLIDSLLDIRLTLSVKRLTSQYINRQDLKKVLNDAKQRAEDIKINEEIDKLFDSYFNKEDNLLSVDAMERKIYEFKGESNNSTMGRSYVKASAPFNSSSYDNNEAA